MRIKIIKDGFSAVWDGVFYKKLSDYPRITDWEIRNIIEFCDYEKRHGRTVDIECEDQELLDHIKGEMSKREKYLCAKRPSLLTECTACPYSGGCYTDLVCHTTSVENAIKIFQCGSLLSAVKARGVPVEELMAEKRNAANDPADYFEYIMLAWGNCQAGDRLVMERALERFPDEKDLSENFAPGVRFYFEYDRLAGHPGRAFDGVLPMKIKNEIKLSEWVYKIIIPESLCDKLQDHIPESLAERVVYIKNDTKDIWGWSHKVYEIVKK